jgi:phage baseplate assembly protein W
MAIYVGYSFPFRKGPTSFPASATDNDLIKQSLIQLISTGRGERVMRPTVGSGAYAFVFESNDVPITTLIQTEVMTVISKWEPRVLLQSVDVQRGNPSDNVNGPATVTITINYIVIATNQAQQLAVTFGGP